MNARFCGSDSATILVALSCANSLWASRSTPWGVVRSLIPTSTAPRPSTSMSPPSAVARPLTVPSDQTWKSASREQRVPAVDRLVVDRLADPGLHAHRVDRDAVVDPRGGVAGEQVVGQRRQEQVVQAERLDHHGRRLLGVLEQLALGHTADQVAHQGVVVETGEGVVERVGGHRPVDPLVEGGVQDVRTRLRNRHRLAQQLVEQVHLDAEVAQRLREPVVLLLGALHPQHVVEEVRVLVRGGEPLQLEVRPVQDRLAQQADLRVHVQPHAVSSAQAPSSGRLHDGRAAAGA